MALVARLGCDPRSCAPMRPYLQSMLCKRSGESPVAPQEYTPSSIEHFGVEIQAFIGATPTGAVDSFDFVVCTPRWFADGFDTTDLRRWGESDWPLRGDSASWQLLGQPPSRPTDERDPVVFAAGLVFMRRWSATKLQMTIEELCARIEGPDWGAVASRLGRVLPWEFAYKYDRAVDAGEPFPRSRPTS
jgi:hypothetical protein